MGTAVLGLPRARPEDEWSAEIGVAEAAGWKRRGKSSSRSRRSGGVRSVGSDLEGGPAPVVEMGPRLPINGL